MAFFGSGSEVQSLVRTIAQRLRRERDRHGISASELARRAGIAKSTLTQLEAEKGNPGVETLWALASALDVPFAELIATPQPIQRVIRAGGGTATYAEHTDYAATLLAACPSGARHNLYRLDLAAGARRESAAHLAGTVEHVAVTCGRLLTGPLTDARELQAGDYMRFTGDTAHVYEAVNGWSSAVLFMEHP